MLQPDANCFEKTTHPGNEYRFDISSLSRQSQNTIDGPLNECDGSPLLDMCDIEPQSDEVCCYVNAATCPDCGAGMVRQGICFTCLSCGWGACG